jgi:hypothetical protein
LRTMLVTNVTRGKWPVIVMLVIMPSIGRAACPRRGELNQAMFKKSYYWALGIGILLIGVGVAVWVQVDAAHDGAPMSQGLRVAEAVVQLEGCLTCHAVTGGGPVWMHEDAVLSSADHTLLTFPESRPQQTVPRTPLETRLSDAGQRILALPESNTKQAETVASSFLRVYEQTRTGTDQTADQMSALDKLDYWLRTLEYQAQTNQWDRADEAPAQPNPAAWQTGSIVLGYAVAVVSEQVSVLDDIAGFSCALRDGEPGARLVGVVFGMHRRGPPAGVVLDSVL